MVDIAKGTLIIFGLFFLALLSIVTLAWYKTRHIRLAMQDTEEKLGVTIIKTYKIDGKWYCLALDNYTGKAYEITLFDESEKLESFDDFVDGLFGDEK